MTRDEGMATWRGWEQKLLATWRRYPVKMTLLGLFVVQQIWLLLPPASDAALFADVPAVPKPIENLRLYGTRPQDGTTVWDGHSGAVLARYPDIKKILALSPNGKQLLLPGGTVFDQETGQKVVLDKKETFERASENWVRFSPDGEVIAGAIQILPGMLDYFRYSWVGCFWKTRTGAFLSCKEIWGNWSGAFSPDSKRFVFGGYDGGVLWDIYGQKEIAVLRRFGFFDLHDVIAYARFGKGGNDVSHYQFYSNKASFSPDGKHILLAGTLASAYVYDGYTGEPISKLSGPLFNVWYNSLKYIDYAQFVAGGNYVVAHSRDGRISLWNAQSGRLKNTFNGYDLFSTHVCPSGFAACLKDRQINGRWIYVQDKQNSKDVYAYDLAEHTLRKSPWIPLRGRIKLDAEGRAIPLQLSPEMEQSVQQYKTPSGESFLSFVDIGSGQKMPVNIGWDQESADFKVTVLSVPISQIESKNQYICRRAPHSCVVSPATVNSAYTISLLNVDTGERIATLYDRFDDDPHTNKDDPTFIFWPQ